MHIIHMTWHKKSFVDVFHLYHFIVHFPYQRVYITIIPVVLVISRGEKGSHFDYHTLYRVLVRMSSLSLYPEQSKQSHQARM